MADDIAKWLEGFGLGKYVQAFADNEIDFEVLPDLTEDNLEIFDLRAQMCNGLGQVKVDASGLR